MCCGFECTKVTLSAVNLLFTVVSFILIGIGTYSKAASIVTNVTIISGTIGCGVFLFFLSLIGLIGTHRHNQVLLFFYMAILFVLFVVQFSVAAACLSFSEEEETELGRSGWRVASNWTIAKAEKFFSCCGFDEIGTTTVTAAQNCAYDCCLGSESCQCDSCGPAIRSAIDSGLNLCGSVGLICSFVQLFAVWLTVRFRNQRDPRSDPSAFL